MKRAMTLADIQIDDLILAMPIYVFFGPSQPRRRMHSLIA